MKVTVNNSVGETAYDIIEFFLNDSPFIGLLNITLLGEPEDSVGTSMTSLFHVNLTNWYDSSDDPYQKLKIKVVAIKTYIIGLSQQTQQYTLTGEFNTSQLVIKMPPFSIDRTSISYYEENGGVIPDILFQNNITLCVQAIDVDHAVDQKCKDF